MLLLYVLLISMVGFVVCDNHEERIVGGEDARLGQFPHQVSLQLIKCYKHHFCGGSILNERYILTSAHCVTRYRPSKIRIVTGTLKLNNVHEKNIYYAEKFIKHPNNTSFRKDDIALIKVDRAIKFNKIVQPVEISEEKVPGDKEVVVSGWGRSHGGTLPNRLQFIELKTIDNKRCRRLHAIRILDSHVCTFTKRGEGVCSGDSGSPLVMGNRQIGITSFSKGCAMGAPDVFVRVSYYVDWIKKVIGDTSTEENITDENVPEETFPEEANHER